MSKDFLTHPSVLRTDPSLQASLMRKFDELGPSWLTEFDFAAGLPSCCFLLLGRCFYKSCWPFYLRVTHLVPELSTQGPRERDRLA